MPPPTPSFMASAEEEGVAFSLVFSFAFYLSFLGALFIFGTGQGGGQRGAATSHPRAGRGRGRN